MQRAACHTRRPAYLHSRKTTTLRARITDRVTVNQSPPSAKIRALVFRYCSWARRDLRRAQRDREMHFSQASLPSLVSAPQGHAVPSRQPFRWCVSAITSSQAKVSLLPGNGGVCSTTAPVYPSYRGAACSLAGSPRILIYHGLKGRPVHHSAFPILTCLP
jgi:hypothetical protein